MQPIDPSSVDERNLNRELDRTKSSVFLGKNAAFLGSVMCSLEFIWSRDTETAATDGIRFWWNPEFFLSLPKESRETVMLHELWHAARLHHVRGGNRNHEHWNYACDIRINNDLEREGHSFKTIEQCWKDASMDANGVLSEEEIYDLLQKNPPPPSAMGAGSFGKGGDGDMEPLSGQQAQQAVNNIVRAVQQAKLSGQAGNIPAGIEQMLNSFLEPVVPWEVVLMKFFTDMLDEDYTWARPNRRFQDMYLPSRFTDDGRLEHLMFYLDTSGSISDEDIKRFNSEVKYIQEQLKPEKLTLVQFDTAITKTNEFEVDDPFTSIKVIGRGGTAWAPVKEHIEKHKPTAAVVFTDMGFWDAVTQLDKSIPIIWAIQNNPHAIAPFGDHVHIK